VNFVSFYHTRSDRWLREKRNNRFGEKGYFFCSLLFAVLSILFDRFHDQTSFSHCIYFHFLTHCKKLFIYEMTVHAVVFLNNLSVQLLTTDILALGSMKAAAKCDTSCELQNSVSHQSA